MKKTLALVLSVILVVSLFAACAGNTPTTSTGTNSGTTTTTDTGTTTDTSTTTTDTTTTTAAPVKLKFWESDVEGGTFLTEAAAEFTALNPHITFEFEPVSHTDATPKILLDGPAGVGPDVFAIPHDMLGSNVASQTVLPNPNPDNIKNSFVPAAVTAATYGGTVYGYPMAIETYALFYNKDLLPTAPKTWDEVVSFAQTYNDPKDNKYAIVWETSNAYFNYIFFSGYGSQLFGPTGDDTGKHNINVPNTVKGVEYFKSLRSILDVPSGDLSGDFCNSAFEGGKAAMYIVGPWRIADCKASGINFGIATIPAFPGESSPPASFSGVRLMCISAYTNYPEESAAFLEFVTTKEKALQRYDMLGQLPARNDVTVDDEYSAGILAQAAYAFPMPSIPEMGQYWSAVGAAYSNVWNGSDPQTELDAAAAVMEAEIAANA